MTMRRVYLHGKAGEYFGRCFELDVNSLAETMRALGSQLPGFRHYVAQNNFRVTLGKRSNPANDLDEGQIADKLGKGDIHVMPVLAGAKRGSGVMKIIAGVLIAAVAWWAAPAAAAGGMGASLIGGVTYGQVAMLGIGLAAAGISQLLAKKPEKEKKDESYSLSGAINTVDQGGPVPLIYGRIRVGSTMVSSGITSADIPIGS